MVAVVPLVFVGIGLTWWTGHWWWVSVTSAPLVVVTASRSWLSFRAGAWNDAVMAAGTMPLWLFGTLGGVTGWVGWWIGLCGVGIGFSVVVAYTTRRDMRRYREWERTWQRRLAADLGEDYRGR